MSDFFKHHHRRNLNAGFTFIEVVAAVAVTGLVVTSVFAIIQGSTADHILAASRLQSAYLAQERIELVRNQRDFNWLQGRPWGDNKDDLLLMSGSEPPLGRFTRTTTVSVGGPGDFVRVEVRVAWEDSRGSHYIDVETKLYGWFNI